MPGYVKRSAAIAAAMVLAGFLVPSSFEQMRRLVRDVTWSHEGAIVKAIVERCELKYKSKRGLSDFGVFPCETTDYIKAREPKRTWHEFRQPYLLLALPDRDLGEERELSKSFFPLGLAVGDAVEVLSNQERDLVIDRPMTDFDWENLKRSLVISAALFPIFWLMFLLALNHDRSGRESKSQLSRPHTKIDGTSAS